MAQPAVSRIVLELEERLGVRLLERTTRKVRLTESGRYLLEEAQEILGRIDVARGAQKTDAAQDFKALLLERGASANAKPELEIFADDVKCAHGAAIGEMDETARFYMAARGIPPEAAQKLLVRAFIADAFAALEDESEQEKLLDAALGALGERA